MKDCGSTGPFRIQSNSVRPKRFPVQGQIIHMSATRATALQENGSADQTHNDRHQGPSEIRRLGQVPGFDGMRGIAVMIVFVAHLEVLLPIPTLLVVPGGTVSLDSFFVLSGFLITALLLREQARGRGIDRLAFYRRRALRLLPPLLAMMIGYAIFAYAAGVRFHEVWTSLLSVGFYYSNWKLAVGSNALGGHIAPGLQHMWSLSVEEQFYLIWPWVTIIFLTVRRRYSTVVTILLLLIAAIAVHRGLTYHGMSNWYSTFVRTDTRADAILIGCLLAHVWIRRREPRRGTVVAAWLAAAFLLVCLPLADLTGPFLYRGGLVAIDVACALVMLGILEGHWRGRRFFELRPLIILGTVSYALYLWHLPVFFAVQHYGHHWSDVTRVVVATAATLALTAGSWFLLERPAMRWKDRLEGRRRTGAHISTGREEALRGEPVQEAEDPGGPVDAPVPLLEPRPGAT